MVSTVAGNCWQSLHVLELVHATIEFNQQGVVGQIVFTELDNSSIQINTSFQPGNLLYRGLKSNGTLKGYCYQL